MSALIAPEELRDDLDRWTVLDVRWQLGRTDGREQHEAGHVPGAAYVDLETDLADSPGPRGRHPLPDPRRFVEAMRRCGVSDRRPVVVYDDVSGTSAARAWWLLRHHGHPDVRVLDGGWSWWCKVGGAVETGVLTPPYGDFTARPGGLPVVDAAGAAELAREGALVDARAPERFRGEVEPVDPVAGHVPGAVNVPTASNLVAEGELAGRFKSREQLAVEYRLALVPGTAVGAYCGSGVTAAHDVLALELVGVTAALYAGSWSEWVTDPSRPVTSAHPG
jgi:thiosulfate/3-mercaptopyruvate sulfurtransferase